MKARQFRVSLLLMMAMLLPVYGATLSGLVVGVTDGDTIKVLDAGKSQHRIRLFGIDSPESHQAFGQKAKQYMSKLVFQKNVRVQYVEKDRYGRILGKVYVGSTYVNLEMVKAGYAWHYVYYAKDQLDLAAAEQAARARKLGLWIDPNPIPPWDYRWNARKYRKQ